LPSIYDDDDGVMASFQLFPYQREALVSLWEAARRARKQNEESGGKAPAIRAACVQPTAAGKTVEILCLVRELSVRWGWRALAIEPTRELVSQTLKKAKRFAADRKVGVVQRRRRKFDDCHLVVSTAGALHKKALAEIDPAEFQVILVDEAHHGAAESYEAILAHFSGALLILGFTATHIRGDGRSVGGAEHFHSIIVYQTIGQLTQAGYLCPARGVYKHTGLTLENVPIRGGEYDKKKLAHAVNTPERNAMAVDAYLEHARGRIGAAFAVNIDHAKDLAEAYNARGVPAAAVWGRMDDKLYEKIMEDFSVSRIMVLCNAKLLSEGWDFPDLSVVILTRPFTETSGRVLGPQMIGRGLRTAEGKIDAVIIELVDLAILSGSRGPREKPNTLATLLESSYGLSRAQIEKGDGYLHEQARKKKVEDAWRERIKLFQSLRTVENVEQTFDVIERVSQVSEFAWIPLGAATYFMNIGEGRFCEVVKEHDNYFEVRAVEESALTFIGSGNDLKSAIAIADVWLASHGINYCLQHRSAPWRQKEPTASQVQAARRLTGLPEKFLFTLRRGQLSDLITSATALLLPFEEVKLPGDKGKGAGSVDAPPVGTENLHVWQFGSNA
jgi:superfamily II DNA or RNA helicase